MHQSIPFLFCIFIPLIVMLRLIFIYQIKHFEQSQPEPITERAEDSTTELFPNNNQEI